MRKRIFYLLVGVSALIFGVALARLVAFVRAEPDVEGVEVAPAVEFASLGDYRISGPYAHGNLSIFLVHGADALPGWSPLTLEEALARGRAVVVETGEVNELSVENLSGEEVFAQAGDIVKGGKQDRALAVDLLLAPHSGRLPLSVFCVEQGRWTPRSSGVGGGGGSGGGGGEDNRMAEAFTMSEMIASPDVKTAVKELASQAAVWAGVARTQTRLAESVGADVRAAESASSLQLTLENEKVRESAEGYTARLAHVIYGKGDVIGYAYAVNGRVSGAEVYASGALFRKLWPRLLKSSAVEAVAESDGAAKAAAPAVGVVQAFLAGAERGGALSTRDVAGRVRVLTRETDQSLLVETRDLARGGAWLHRSYLARSAPAQ